MDDATKHAYIRTRLSKARKDLAAARSLLTLGYLRVDDAERFVNRVEQYLRQVGAI